MDTEKEEVRVGAAEEVKATLDGSGSDSAGSEHGEHFQNEKAEDGIILIPQPSSDPRDPLNWAFRRKAIQVAVLSIAMFTGYAAPFCGQLNLTQQSVLYGKTTTEITYFNSAASAGLATGGFLWYPLSAKFGRSSVIFYALLGCLGCQIWAPLMTGANQYAPYLVSRYLSGFFGMVVSVLGPRCLTDLFFLHQRGRAFTVLHFALNFGASAGPTFSGFIAANHSWTIEYWWSVALTAVVLIFVFAFLEETGWDRSEGAENARLSDNYLANRVQTFLPGTKTVGAVPLSHVAKVALKPFKIAIAPVVLLVAGFDTISFGFYIALNALTPIWLQKPEKLGGYGFSITQNAAFTFVHWIGFITGLVYGHYFSDRIPLWLAARNGGKWKPEYRLHALWFTSFILQPIGLGMVGAALLYHLHWMVFAVGQIFVTIGCLVSIPITVNYICECFRSHTTEAVIPVNSMRLWMGLSINFYINQWVSAVNIGWVYGMMGFFTVFSFFFLMVLMWKGHVIREWTPFGMGSSEEGETVVEKEPLTQHGV